MANIDDPDHLKKFMQAATKPRLHSYVSSKMDKKENIEPASPRIAPTETTFGTVHTLKSKDTSNDPTNREQGQRSMASRGESHAMLQNAPSKAPEYLTQTPGAAETVTPKKLPSTPNAKDDASPGVGYRAPPPTPEVSARKAPAIQEDLQEIVGSHVSNHLAGKAPADLGQSVHAPRQRQPLISIAEGPDEGSKAGSKEAGKDDETAKRGKKPADVNKVDVDAMFNMLKSFSAKSKPSPHPVPPVSTKEKVETKSFNATEMGFSGLYFKQWPSREQRHLEPPRVRRVFISNIDDLRSEKKITSLVFGGPLESIILSTKTAMVTFLNPDDCQKFYRETANGLVWGKDDNGGEKIAWVELAREVDIIPGKLREMVDNGATRCVRASGRSLDPKIEDVFKIPGAGKLAIEDVNDARLEDGQRIVTFLFCKIHDAVIFKGQLQKDEEWEPFNIQFCKDP